MANIINLEAQTRDQSKTVKALRREGILPGIMYGRGFETVHLQFPQRELGRAIITAGTHQLVSVDIEGESAEHLALFREVQRDPVTDRVLHVDFYRTVAGEAITSTVPIVTTGSAPAVELGGTVSQLLTEVEIECLPKDLPGSLEVDLSALVELDSAITLGDLDIPAGVTVLLPEDTEVARMYVMREAPEEEEEAEDEGLILGTEEATEESEATEAESDE